MEYDQKARRFGYRIKETTGKPPSAVVVRCPYSHEFALNITTIKTWFDKIQIDKTWRACPGCFALSFKFGRRQHILEQAGCTCMPIEHFLARNGTEISFVCPQGHREEMAVSYFDKRSQRFNNGKLSDICGLCTRVIPTHLEEAKERCTELGHEYLRYEGKRKISYRCGQCHREQQTTIASMTKMGRSKYCRNCPARN